MFGFYGQNKILSIGFPFGTLLILLSFFQPDDPLLWWILVVMAHTLGYVHFGLGYLYQLKSILRKPEVLPFVWFGLLTVGAIVVSEVFIWLGFLPLLSIIAIAYFLFHGACNETTLMERQIGYSPTLSLMIPFTFFLFPFFLLSLTHPSFFFTPQLTFLNPPPTTTVTLLSNVITLDVLQILALISLALFCVFVPLRLIYQKRFWAGVSIGAITLCMAFFLVKVYPLHYVMLYFVALTPHFISWSYYFYQTYREQAPEQIPHYVRDHVFILLPLVALSIASVYIPVVQTVHQYVFNGVLFVTFAMVHNTTSLLNEVWFKRLIGVV